MTPDVRPVRILWGIALIAGVCPLWVAHELPLVDLPQHLHLISVLHRLNDATTLYPELFARRPELTPYLGYYYVVSLLNWLMPIELANRLFLTAYVAGMPLSLAFLLKSLKRPTWPALLAIPFAYGDSFAWGFINYVSALPLTFLTCGLFVRAIKDVAHRLKWALLLGASLCAVLLFHVQAFAYLGVALPFLLLTTSAVEGRTWLARRHALAGVVPGVLLFAVWMGLRLGQPSEIVPGQPWKSWGPVLSPENLSWKTYEQNRADLVPVLGNMLSDQSDLKPVYGAGAVALLALVLALKSRIEKSNEKPEEGPIERWRMAGLAALALVLFFALPFDIRGYMYYLNTRFAHLAAPLVLAAVPIVPKPSRLSMLALAAAVAVWCGLTLASGFKAFDEEARQLTALADSTAQKPRVMGLIYGTGSRAVTHPVFLHASTVLARLRGGVTNFSFALTPHSPVMYRGAPPPTFASEWRPDQMNWQAQGYWFDHFVVRGVDPRRIFGPLLDNELTIAAQSGDFWLVRKK